MKAAVCAILIIDAIGAIVRPMREADDDSAEPNEPQPFQIPLPPPPLGPFGPHRRARDIVFFAHDPGEGGPGGGGREDEDIMLRRVPTDVAQRFRAAAGARGMTHAKYLTALVELHEEMRRRADAGDAELAAELERLRLATVSI
jgi:hypothetical protein